MKHVGKGRSQEYYGEALKTKADLKAGAFSSSVSQTDNIN